MKRLRKHLIDLWGRLRLWSVKRKLAANAWEPSCLCEREWELLKRYDQGTYHNLRDFAEECPQ